MKVDWETAPKISKGQKWKHKKTGQIWEVRNASGYYYAMKNKSGSKVHHTSEKDIHLHFTLI